VEIDDTAKGENCYAAATMKTVIAKPTVNQHSTNLFADSVDPDRHAWRAHARGTCSATKTARMNVRSEANMNINSTTRELVADCLSRIGAGDQSAAFDLASAFMGHLHEKDIDLNLSVIEALAVIARAHGCREAEDFLKDEWSALQPVLRKRWTRAGFNEPTA
jgi:hypothetical protein